MKKSKNLFDINGKVVIITGAMGQLGIATAKTLASQGAKVAITDINSEKCKELAEKLNYEYPRSAIGCKCDVTNVKSIEKMCDFTIKKFGRIDSLINNAGIGVFTPFEERTEKELDSVIDVNIKGAIFCSKIASRHMKTNKQGSIINIASIYGIVSSDKRIYGNSKRNNSEIYGMTKAGIINFTKYLATHLAEDRIRVNAISPGGIFNNQKEFFVKNYVNKTPLGKMASVDDFQGAIIYLISDASSYMTGNNLTIDGGFTSW